MPFEGAGLTDVGQKRGHNEDAFELHLAANIAVVADGVGGGRSGEVASQLAVKTIGEFFRVTSIDPEATWPYKLDPSRSFDENRIAIAIQLANNRIIEEQRPSEALKGMSSTVVALMFSGARVFTGHVGDSRAYRVRLGASGPVIEQLTEDHTLLNDYKKLRHLTAEEVDAFPYKNVIVRALGMKDAVQVDVTGHDMKSGDVYLLCSDGLSGLVSNQQIMDTIVAVGDLNQSAARLVALANANGGHDNITAVLVRYTE